MIEVYPDDRGIVRGVKVSCQGEEYVRAVEQLELLEPSCEAAEEEESPSRDNEPQEDVHISEDVDEEEVHVAKDVLEDESFAHVAGRDIEHESPVPLSVREKSHRRGRCESSMLTPPHNESITAPEATPMDVTDTPPVVTRRPSRPNRPTRQAAVHQRRMLRELLDEDLV